MIGIIMADSNEINKFPFEIKEIKNNNQFKFIIFTNDVIAVHSGIGIANAAAVTQELISSFDIREIINYGAVGANKFLNVYDVVTPKKVFYHDVITPWYKRGQSPGEKEFYLNALTSKNNNNLGTSSSFITNEDEIEKIKDELNVDIFDMEAAAIAQIADKNNIPLKIIKVVSDVIGLTNASDVEDINTRIKKAGEIAFNEMLKQLIEH